MMIKEIFCFPGNAGTGKIATNIDLDIDFLGIGTRSLRKEKN